MAGELYFFERKSKVVRGTWAEKRAAQDWRVASSAPQKVSPSPDVNHVSFINNQRSLELMLRKFKYLDGLTQLLNLNLIICGLIFCT
jgi:hypothetical protein